MSHGFPTVIIDHDTSVKGLRQLYYRPEFRYSLACHVIHSSLSTVNLILSNSAVQFRAIRKSNKVASCLIHDFPVMYGWGWRLISNTL